MVANKLFINLNKTEYLLFNIKYFIKTVVLILILILITAPNNYVKNRSYFPVYIV